MTNITDTQRIYVASLSDYNGGRLHGVWIDLGEIDDIDDLWAKVNAMLAASPEYKEFPQGGPAEEWAIHDYEGFGEWRLGEWESFEKVLRAAKGIEEKGMAFAALLGEDDSFIDDDDGLDWFDGCYCGEWDSEEDYARSYVEDVGLPGIGTTVEMGAPWGNSNKVSILDELESYLDWDALTRWATDGMAVVKTPEHNVWVFRSEP